MFLYFFNYAIVYHNLNVYFTISRKDKQEWILNPSNVNDRLDLHGLRAPIPFLFVHAC